MLLVGFGSFTLRFGSQSLALPKVPWDNSWGSTALHMFLAVGWRHRYLLQETQEWRNRLLLWLAEQALLARALETHQLFHWEPCMLTEDSSVVHQCYDWYQPDQVWFWTRLSYGYLESWGSECFAVLVLGTHFQRWSLETRTYYSYRFNHPGKP